MSNRTNAERQRRYINKLKNKANMNNQKELEIVELKKIIDELEEKYNKLHDLFLNGQNNIRQFHKNHK